MSSDQPTRPEESPAPVFPPSGPPDAAGPDAGAAAASSTPSAPPSSPGDAPRRGRTRYRIILSLLFILSCLGMFVSTTVLWVHQVALNTDRWVQVVGPVIEDPAVRVAVSTRVADRVVTALDVQGRLEAVLPGPLEVIAAPVAQQVEDGIQRRVETAMATPEFQAAWYAANRVAHQKIVDILRGKSESVYVQDGYVVLDVWPLVGIALGQLQAAGIIPAGVQLPDLSQGLPPGAFDRLDAVLGGRLPDDLGTFPLVPADRLEQAQQVVSLFDWVTVGIVVLTVVLILLTIWYAIHRRRTIVLLGVGGAVTLVLARFAIESIRDSIIAGVSDAGTAATLRGVVTLALDDLFSLTRLVIVLGVGVAVVAYLSGRPAWATELATQARSTTGRAAAGVGTLAQAGRGEVPRAEAVAAWARANRRALNLLGLGTIAFVVLWLGVGFWIALLAVALVALLEFGLGLLGGSDATAETSPAPEPTTAAVPPDPNT